MQSELIVSTYNSPRALALSLASVRGQRVMPGGIAVADDGSGPETATVVDAFRAANPGLAVRHVWHEDRGFAKAAILNRAIATSGAEILVFIDGDVMIHPEFVARHLEMAAPDRWSSGSLIRLDADASAAVTEADVTRGLVFDRDWLRRNRAFDRVGSWLKAMPFPKPVMARLDAWSPVQRAWCGANASAHRAAILRVNGFDETMRWGGGDKDLGVRLSNSGVKGRRLRFTAPLVHLDHPRGYADPAHKAANRARIKAIRAAGTYWAEDGIVKASR